MRARALLTGVVVLALASGALAKSAPAPRAAAEVPRLRGEKLAAESERKLEEMRAALGQSFEELKRARGSGDIQRLSCVNGQLTAVKGLVRLAEQSYVALREAQARGDDRAAGHEFVKMALAEQKVADLSSQLRACAGPAVATVTDGQPELEVIADPKLPDAAEGLTDWYRATEVVLQVPTAASPFL